VRILNYSRRPRAGLFAGKREGGGRGARRLHITAEHMHSRIIQSLPVVRRWTTCRAAPRNGNAVRWLPAAAYDRGALVEHRAPGGGRGRERVSPVRALGNSRVARFLSARARARATRGSFSPSAVARNATTPRMTPEASRSAWRRRALFERTVREEK